MVSRAAVFCYSWVICCEKLLYELFELSDKLQNVETYSYCFGPYLNSCLLDTEAGFLVVRFLQLPLYINRWHVVVLHRWFCDGR